jgi:type VI secretion system protein ImpM
MHAQDPETISPLVGYVGKLPAQADFVRQHVSDRIGGEFDKWLVKATQNVLLAKIELPASPVRFVFSAPQCDSVVIGVLVASRDQVGRTFPLAIYTALAAPVAARNAHGLPLAYEQFLDEAEIVAAKAATATAAELRAGVAGLHPPGQDVVLAAAERCRNALQQTPARDMFERAFGRALPDAPWYGVHTVLVAGEASRSAPASSAPTVLDCPIASDVDLAAWLDLGRRLVPTSVACPSFIWVQPFPRLLFVLGYASEQLLQFATDPKNKSARLWPLTTERADAVTRARDLLGAQLGSIEAGAAMNLDALWAVLTRGLPSRS